MTNYIPGLVSFVGECCSTAYVEAASELHTELSKRVWQERCKPTFDLPSGAHVLDLGCGSGHSTRMFEEEGFLVTAVSCLIEEIRAVNVTKISFGVQADMHVIGLELRNNKYNMVWARHVLEHSPIPAFVLSEINHITKDEGYLYVEVPAPSECGSASLHESNQNHWSIMGKTMWMALIERAGFAVLEPIDIRFATAVGDEIYYGFICQKKTVDKNSSSR